MSTSTDLDSPLRDADLDSDTRTLNSGDLNPSSRSAENTVSASSADLGIGEQFGIQKGEPIPDRNIEPAGTEDDEYRADGEVFGIGPYDGITDYNADDDDDPNVPPDKFIELDPVGVVQSWEILTVGRRPKDFMARDLLLNSLFRDERPRIFHSMAKKPMVWLKDHVRDLPSNQQDQAIQLDILHLLHRRHLARLKNGDFQYWDLDTDGEYLLGKLGACWPYGALMAPPRRPEYADGTPGQHCCGLAWLCPWCYARRAVGLYQLLQEGPLRQRNGKHLVLAVLRTYGEQTPPDSTWELDWSSRCSRGDYYLQSPQRVRRLRYRVTKVLREYARLLNISGGIITHQVSPWKTGYPMLRTGVPAGLATFRHDYAMFGEVTFSTEEEQERFQRLVDYREHCGHIIIKDPNLREGGSVYLNWCAHPADNRKIDALRLFLFGSSMNYPVRELEFLSSSRFEKDRIHGAFALQPNFMMNDVQWWTYEEATRRLPLYVPFGTWRTAIHEAKKAKLSRRKAAMQLPSPGRTAAWKRGKALKAANARRKQDAQDSFGSLVEVARPLLAQAVAEQTGKRGRPAHRARLKELLREAGYSVSAHQMRKLMATLRGESRG